MNLALPSPHNLVETKTAKACSKSGAERPQNPENCSVDNQLVGSGLSLSFSFSSLKQEQQCHVPSWLWDMGVKELRQHLGRTVLSRGRLKAQESGLDTFRAP